MNIKIKKKTLLILASPIILCLLLYFLRVPIFKSISSYLSSQDELSKCEVIFVLAGSPNFRGKLVAKYYFDKVAPKIVCTGNEKSLPDGRGDWYSMGEMTRFGLLNLGVDTFAVEYVAKGNSTFTESEAIKEYCVEHGLKKVMIVSTLFHTRRVRQVFEDKLNEAGVEVLIRGADDESFEEESWWKDAYGFTAVNNEIMKILYYKFRY